MDKRNFIVVQDSVASTLQKQIDLLCDQGFSPFLFAQSEDDDTIHMTVIMKRDLL